MNYSIIRTDKADSGIRSIILYIAQAFGNNVALKKLDEMEKAIEALATDPYRGIEPRYHVLRKQGYRVLVLEKDLVFYKVNEEERTVIVHAVVDQRQDYLNIINGV